MKLDFLKKNSLLFYLSWFIHCLLILLSVAFFTLFERKVMGLFHLRMGPNKTTYQGLFQPLLDAFKLLTKQNMVPFRSNKTAYHSSPFMALHLSLFLWMTLPFFYTGLYLNYSFLLFFCLGSIMVFPVLFSGWASNSKYSLMGSLRSVAQSISYESVFSTLMVLSSVLILSYSSISFLFGSSFLFFVFFPLWFVCTLAETHRAPFDFSESESELVSGFNTEYSGVYFAFLFLAEYSVLLFSCVLMSYVFFSWGLPSMQLLIILTTMLLSFVFIWVRITFCRFRYDKLMALSWKILLPFTLIIFLGFIVLLS